MNRDMIGLYDISVPVFGRYLHRLDGIILRVAERADGSDEAEAGLLSARLVPDMLLFETQVRIAARFPLRALRPLLPRLPEVEFPPAASLAELGAGIGTVIGALASVAAADRSYILANRPQTSDRLITVTSSARA